MSIVRTQRMRQTLCTPGAWWCVPPTSPSNGTVLLCCVLLLTCLPSWSARGASPLERQQAGFGLEVRFDNGDRLDARLEAIRGGELLLRPAVAPHMVMQVALRRVRKATTEVDQKREPERLELVRGPAMDVRLESLTSEAAVVQCHPLGRVSVALREIRSLTPGGAQGQRFRAAPPPGNHAASEAPRKEVLTALWDQLGAADVDQAFTALVALAALGDGAVPALRKRLIPGVDWPVTVGRLIRDLDADAWTQRDTAMTRLVALGYLAEPALRRVLAGSASLEVRWRAREAIKAVRQQRLPSSRELIRAQRALRVLELIGSSAARTLIADVAEGPDAALTVERAEQTLARMPASADPTQSLRPAVADAKPQTTLREIRRCTVSFDRDGELRIEQSGQTY